MGWTVVLTFTPSVHHIYEEQCEELVSSQGRQVFWLLSLFHCKKYPEESTVVKSAHCSRGPSMFAS